MFRLLAFTFFLISGPVLATDKVPQLDIQSTCNAATPLVPQDRSPRETCLKDEDEAKGELEQQWAGFALPLRERCAQETNIGGYPSYVELLTCLQIASGNFLNQRDAGYRRPGR